MINIRAKTDERWAPYIDGLYNASSEWVNKNWTKQIQQEEIAAGLPTSLPIAPAPAGVGAQAPAAPIDQSAVFAQQLNATQAREGRGAHAPPRPLGTPGPQQLGRAVRGQGLGAAIGLQAAQHASRRNVGGGGGGEIPALRGDTGLSENSINAFTQDLISGAGFNAPTYAARPANVEPPLAGEVDEEGGGLLPSVAEEAEQLRAKERAGLALSQELTGAGGEEEGALIEEENEDEAGGDIDAESEGTISEQPGQDERAMQLAREQYRDAVQQEAQEREEEQSSEIDTQSVGIGLKTRAVVLRVSEDLVDVANIPDTVGMSFIVLLVRKNIQLAGKYFFKNLRGTATQGNQAAMGLWEQFMNQTFPETFLTCCFDIGFCMSFPFQPPCCYATAIIFLVAIIAGAIQQHLLGA